MKSRWGRINLPDGLLSQWQSTAIYRNLPKTRADGSRGSIFAICLRFWHKIAVNGRY